MAYSARQRFDICLSQCLAAVVIFLLKCYVIFLQVSGFVSHLRLMSPAAMERMALIGLLVQFESLLSTQGSEMGMLADMYSLNYPPLISIGIAPLSPSVVYN